MRELERGMKKGDVMCITDGYWCQLRERERGLWRGLYNIRIRIKKNIRIIN